MSKSKRGMSKDEKRVTMVNYLLDHPVPFSMKELEKIGPKLGVIYQSVKDAVMDGVHEGVIDSDKCGTNVLFWAFPSKAAQTRETRLKQLQDKIRSTKDKIETLKTARKELRKGREETKERKERQAKLAKLREENQTIIDGLEEFRENDPETLKKMEDTVSIAKEAANRWTDNILAIRSYAKNQFHMEEEQISVSFTLPTELDYVE
ncbi:putative Meiotic nuclear division protein 1 [Monocercomonoides exilis]|uniref:putative Meiotic nuclear division protein 1 n=1 Tax=Monocercomonoides exilis TaxID=2049356 RepID=UPI0035596099|nr:putative Meiotic nuclear division protein 1 [Monocercomonoides exilis]|eukprot:MONOS_9105.1-p1 / transcript=MONOS_9105.1 / gene=MONOS_9105 / organism=Monocercomonoides_exilis_PA203 / gene_product=Meiotic nuclear division protein 1 homolog / transcript_product=Meiotic nuclear division protein 1 homolog / location=Mono_scaffold00365:14906-15860(+) / protein_length=206 / sequence_SO=supercontig / SO=protein_coding / is_pseudo=false